MKLKNIKNQFDKREIAPSENSWERLAAQLDSVDKKKKRPLVYWISAVAAILIVALMASQLLLPGKDNGTVETGTLVDESTKINAEINNSDNTDEAPVVANTKEA